MSKNGLRTMGWREKPIPNDAAGAAKPRRARHLESVRSAAAIRSASLCGIIPNSGERSVAKLMPENIKFDACVDWFYANRDSLLPLYHGKFVVCADGKVIGAWGNFSLAAANAVDMGYKPGDFAVQHCVTEEEESRVRVYTPWVDFSKTGVKV